MLNEEKVHCIFTGNSHCDSFIRLWECFDIIGQTQHGGL